MNGLLPAVLYLVVFPLPVHTEGISGANFRKQRYSNITSKLGKLEPKVQVSIVFFFLVALTIYLVIVSLGLTLNKFFPIEKFFL